MDDKTYQVELVWNREFHFVPHGKPHDDIGAAIAYAEAMENMGDGERVKKTRVVDGDGNVVYAHRKMVEPSKVSKEAGFVYRVGGFTLG